MKNHAGAHIRTALERRRSELGDAPGSSVPAHEDQSDPEIAETRLRQLMTQLLPKFSGKTAGSEHAARAVALLLSIEVEAGQSLRFLDAFAVYFELAATAPALEAEPNWASVLAAYGRAIDRYLANEGYEAELRAIGAHWADLRHPPHADSPAITARVLILADHAFTGYRILKEVAKIHALRAHVLICRHASVRRSRFVATQLKALAWTGLRYPLGFVLSLMTRRWSLSLQPLDSPGVIDRIRSERFDVGLHGLGVIYRPAVLESFAVGILNAHIGFLPPFRGRSVVEWSLVFGGPIGTSVFLMDAGIDTGARMVCWLAQENLPDSLAVLRQHLFRRDGKCYATALRRMLEPGFRFATNEVALGRRYYVASKLLRGIAERALLDRKRSPMSA